jgi:hypothetical protein
MDILFMSLYNYNQRSRKERQQSSARKEGDVYELKL